MSSDAWETHYRWEWFRREAWRPGFRASKRGRFGGSCGCFAEIVRDLGGGPVLDCTCGLGLKTIVMKEMGLDVVGSDGCAFGVEKARELAALDGLDVEYFTSTWAKLPERMDARFTAIFNDALSWTLTREDFEASLRGLRDALAPGGVLVFMGAPEDAPSDDESRRTLLLETYHREPPFRVEWTHEDAGVCCTAIAVRELGDDHFDEHHLYLVRKGDTERLEVATLRQPVTWDWPTLVELFSRTGFATLETRAFPGRTHDGGTLRLNVATK